MDKLAVELLTLISIYACTDGGQTGCSLALVSKRIRAASRPARFFTVALVNGPAKIEQFLECFQAERSRATESLPRIRHLCLSLIGKGIDTSTASAFGAPVAPASQPKTRAEFFAAMQRRTQHWQSTQDNLDEQYNRVVPVLIRAVAPDVLTFALIQAQWRSSSVVRCCFPQLRDLIVVGGDPSYMPFEFLPSSRPVYPSLKRLHHVLAFVGRDVNFIHWAAHAPNLTHLFLSRVDYTPRVTIDTLDQVIGDAASDEFWPHLQDVMLQPRPPPPAVQSNAAAHLTFRAFLDHLNRVRERAKVPVMVLPPAEIEELKPGIDPHQVCIKKLKTEWMKRIAANTPGYWELEDYVPGSSH